MKKINTGGFTLIEILVVLIIVGILAAIALASLFNNIQKSKGSQALAMLGSDKVPLEACLAKNNTLVPNTAPCTLVGQNLTVGPQNGWTYSIAAAVVAQSASAGSAVAPAGKASDTPDDMTYTLSAVDAGLSTITLTRVAGGTWNCSIGTASHYTGLC